MHDSLAQLIVRQVRVACDLNQELIVYSLQNGNMGSNASKSETKVFTPKAPVDYSASFLSHLESSKESDFTRAQYTESYIQERVAEELKKLEREAIDKFQETATSSVSKASGKEFSASSSNQKIASLSKLLQENARLVQLDLDKSVEAARDDVVACLKENKGQSLNCWEEVDKFKKLVHGL